MSWQKPSEEKCPKCGSYMVEKGNKLACANEQCGFSEEKPKKDEKIFHIREKCDRKRTFLIKIYGGRYERTTIG